MVTRVESWLGMAVVFVTLLMAYGVLTKISDERVIPLHLAHVCSQQELSQRGDGREIFVRHLTNGQSFVNQNVMPVESDLRRTIRGIMSTRAEPSLFFAADKDLSYGEVAGLLAKLEHDSPNLVVFLTTRSQSGSHYLREAETRNPLIFCTPRITR
jgi:biopolymer transport protein ExbD